MPPSSPPLDPLLLTSLNLLDQGMAVFDRELKMLAWNQPFVEMLDFPSELAFVGSPFEHLVRFNVQRSEYGAGDPETQVAKRMAAVRSGKRFVGERLRPNGQILSIRGEPLPGGGLVVLYTDVTEQRRAAEIIQHHQNELEDRVRDRTVELQTANAALEVAVRENGAITAALRRSEERMRLITDTIPAMVGYVDRNTVYQFANRVYSDWFGKRNDELIGRTIEQGVGTTFWAKVREHVKRAMEGHRVSYEYSLERADGSTVYARSTLIPELGADGQVLGCFIHSLDITDQKHTQAALMQAQKMEAVGQLTGGIAHDFNNMLTVVIGNLGALKARREADREVCDYLDPALQATERGVELIRRLLAFSRQQPLEPRPVQVASLITGMTKLLRRSLPETISFHSLAEDESVYAMTDPHQLESALLNLTLNARDAMPNGGTFSISYRIQAVPSLLADELEVAPGQYVCLQIQDDGVGMSPKTLARVLEPFFTTKPFGSGSGLGLSMVYGFLRQSGGGIRILSRVNEGTTIELLLPVADPAAMPETHFSLADPAMGFARPLVLLVEDDPEVRRVVRLQLTGLGYPVLEAASGDEALTMVENVEDIGLVLSDIVMPGNLDGWHLRERIQALRPQVHVALMSGYADGISPEDERAAQVTLLTKPFRREELSRALESHLQTIP